MATEGCLGRESPFPLRVKPLVDKVPVDDPTSVNMLASLSCTSWIMNKTRSLRDGTAGKGTCYRVQSRVSHGERSKSIPESCPLIFTGVVVCVDICHVYTHTHTPNKKM